MNQNQNSKQYDLEERTLQFARKVREFVKRLPRTMTNLEDGPQLIRSSGSPGANYIEANESLSQKDFVMRIKIARKESKESKYWLNLVDTNNDTELEHQRKELKRVNTRSRRTHDDLQFNNEKKCRREALIVLDFII